jgi:hypothetical protein
MQVFVNISSRDYFYSEELCPSAFIGWLELRWASFLPRSQLLFGRESILILFFTLRWSLAPIRDQSLVAHPSSWHRPHFLGVGPSRWSKPITILLRDPANPPFCKSIRTYTTYVDPPVRTFTLWVQPHRQTVLDPPCPHLYIMGRPFWVTLTIHHRPLS